MGKKGPLLSVIIPVYNEADTVEELVAKVKTSLLAKEIIIVDDGSTDGTRQKIESLASDENNLIRARFLATNSGKGFAIRRALEDARGQIVLIQDADLEYDPRNYEALVAPIVDGVAQVVYGSRLANRHFFDIPFTRYLIANWVLTFLANLLYSAHISDEPVCYKAFTTELLKSIPLRCERFEFCPEVTAKLRKRGHKIYTVPVYYYPRAKHEGKKIGWRDGLEAIWTLVKYRFVD